MEDAEKRRRRRSETWTTTVLRDDVHPQMQAQDQRDIPAMSVSERLELCWELSREQYGLIEPDAEERLSRDHALDVRR